MMAKRRLMTSAPNIDRLSRLIQSDDFPFEFLSSVAERESWRKEIYRPVYHIHKWWAKRLGSVFRGIILGCLLPRDTDLTKAFYEAHDFSGVTVLDPFLGSGTTVGEAHKLGCTALGRDINPVACESVRVALGPLDGKQLTTAFEQLSDTVGQRIRELYRSPDGAGPTAGRAVFLLGQAGRCPHCEMPVDLFPTRIFARNAYPHRKPEVQVCCPQCGDVFAHTTRVSGLVARRVPCPSIRTRATPPGRRRIARAVSGVSPSPKPYGR